MRHHGPLVGSRLLLLRVDSTVMATVTFEEVMGSTLIVVHDQYLSKEALDDAIATGSRGAIPEQLEQFESFLRSEL
jgi:hypothetical protein